MYVTIPNLITIGRLLLVPLIIWFVVRTARRLDGTPA